VNILIVLKIGVADFHIDKEATACGGDFFIDGSAATRRIQSTAKRSIESINIARDVYRLIVDKVDDLNRGVAAIGSAALRQISIDRSAVDWIYKHRARCL